MKSEVLQKLARYCAYQERCVWEIQVKMESLAVLPEDQKPYLEWLEENNYLNQERFAKLFVRSKFNQKSWGRNKIKFELKRLQVKDSLIQKALEELLDLPYEATLESMLKDKFQQVKDPNEWSKKQKCYQYAMRKGFEADLISMYMQQLK
ncbi:regulatory protein RecX [Aquirufa aurantiipilula]|uniref:regulatory protein RecX n=1 Tax=Aquirufa aurantiipilula TaxID=2696561 RepID=UPI001CAA77A1|nr:regulatory protein RecX [Aquirufa aurantiipilula]MBZ1325950.1 RecX family transcriptional regulator [Aquirufa aurantiipilula]